MDSGRIEYAMIRTGIVSGLAACLIYPLLMLVSMPVALTATLIAGFGPALALASLGLGNLLRLDHDSFWARLAPVLNIIAGVLFTSMLLVQAAVGIESGSSPVSRQVQAVWLGLDVAWDFYLGLGTAFFSLAMFKHPKFGKVIGSLGLLLAVGLLALNLYTFPTPPANAHLIDLGPGIGLWYFIVTLLVWRALPWARSQLNLADFAPTQLS
jgi:hypothetical protein